MATKEYTIVRVEPPTTGRFDDGDDVVVIEDGNEVFLDVIQYGIEGAGVGDILEVTTKTEQEFPLAAGGYSVKFRIIS